MSYKCGSSGSKGTPPQTADTVLLDALAQQSRASRALGLHGGLESIDGGQGHTEGRRAIKRHGHISCQYGSQGRLVENIQGISYQREAKMVWTSVGNWLR